jgi:lysophospholipase L1-like esterase
MQGRWIHWEWMQMLGTLLPVLILLVMAMLSEARLAAASPSEIPPPITWLALGDSYTIGQGVPAAQRWPEQVVARLHAATVPFDSLVTIAGTGWTTDELNQQVSARAPGPARIVSIQIGVNDQFRGHSTAEFERSLTTLLAHALTLVGGVPDRLLALSIPDWGVSPFAQGRDRKAIGQAIDAFNAVYRRTIEAAGAHWLDITGLSRAIDTDSFADDGLHPSKAMYGRWAEQVEPVIASMLGHPAGPRSPP